MPWLPNAGDFGEYGYAETAEFLPFDPYGYAQTCRDRSSHYSLVRQLVCTFVA